jgi:hypothetical protein
MSKKDSGKPIFSIENLRNTPPRTPQDIRRAVVEGRFAEMTPHLAGYDDIGSSADKSEPKEVAYQSDIGYDASSSHKRSIRSNMRPIIFLDMDDVLCLSDKFGSREMLKIIQQEVPDRPELWSGLVDAEAAVNLYELHTEFIPWYVISSSWPTYLDHGQMCHVLMRTSLKFVVDNLHNQWKTPRALSSSRRDEINWWLDSHRENGQPFLVIDDSYSGTELAHSPLALDGHVVLCKSGYGFTKKRLKEAKYQLRRQLAN